VSLLRRTMLANGLFSITTGLMSAVLASSLSDLWSIPSVVLSVIGPGVVVFGVALVRQAAHIPTDQRFALFAVGADAAWVAAAIVVLIVPGSMSGSGKWVLVSVSALVGLFAVLQIVGLVEATRANPKVLITKVEIAADPTSVWSVLTDLESFDDWNPFITKGSGQIAVGEALRLLMEPPGGRAMTFTPTVTEVTARGRLEWLGHLLRPGVFDGRHRFELEAIASGTRLTQSEEFTGFLVPALARSLDSRTRAGFEAMNLAIKERVEVGSKGLA